MRKRRSDKRSAEISRYTIAVTAASLRIGRTGPNILSLHPDGDSDTTIHIEGALDRPVIRMKTANILVLCREREDGDPGSAIGGNEIWQIVVGMPRAQFTDLLALVLADKLARVNLLFGPVRYGKGTLRSIDFETAPLPSEAEEDEPPPNAGG